MGNLPVRNLEDKVTIVTGGAAGIGGAVTRAFVARGSKVVAVDLNEEAGAAIVEELGHNVEFVAGDVSDPEVAKTAVSRAVERFGQLDALVNNAHASKQGSFLEHTDAMWDLSFNTGFYPTVHLMQACYPHLKASSGSVINFASGSGLDGMPTQASYAAAKEAIRGLSRVAANEWAADGIRVNLVSPVALTPGIQGWATQFPAEYEAVVQGVPLGRLGDPQDDIAPVVAFLASDDSRYVTGQTIMTDGGSNMRP